ncbi:alkaline phosphatase family protein [Diaminobutyricibacter sp. McL0608]|uniref:alkaline phosphatase family protein n=1 Tax=Leifsonia sp. McL0608 TaxID=3143537 RepID=UPI0031F32D4D
MIRRPALATAFVALTLALAACTSSAGGPSASPGSSSSTSGTQSGSPRTPLASSLQHVVIIVDENKTATSIIGNSAAPFLNGLARKYATAYQYSGVTHPSLPNYLAMTSGTTAGINTDCNPPGGSCLVTGPNIAQALDRSHRTWKMYAESMPTPCSVRNTKLYAVKHIPFLFFPSVTSDPSYCASHVVRFSQFAADLASTDSLPNYSFISPNLCNDMHNCSIATGDAWLAAVVPSILRSPAFTQQRSLLVVTFDEGDSSDNVIACVFAGSAAAPHAKSTAPFNHYSLLRTIEGEWGLPPMTANDASALPMTPLLR